MAEVNAVEKQPVTQEYLKKMDAYWRAANYLGAAQLYLLDNPLLRRAVDDGSYKEKDRRTLGNRSGTELCIRSFKPCHQKI
ncbi:MAG: hypothetical protein ACLU6P_10000 [Roseburia intestinalis]